MLLLRRDVLVVRFRQEFHERQDVFVAVLERHVRYMSI